MMTIPDLRVFLVPAAVVLAAIVAELFARWWVRHRTGYYVFPPGLRQLLHPHAAVFPQLEPSIRFEVNRDGERGEEVPALPSGQFLYRVLVAGGSQPEGYLLDQYTSWPGALHCLLQQPEHLERLGASRAHVGSIARSGVGSEALGLILDRVLPRYPRLQAIVILVGASDVLRWLEQGAPPFPPAAAPVADVFRRHPELEFSWRPKRLALVDLALRLRQQWLRPLEVHERAGSWIGRARAMRAQATVVRTTMPDPGVMLAHFERHLRQVLAKAMSHADRVIVVRQPWFDRACTPEEAALMWHGGAGQAWREDVTTYYSHDVLSRLMGHLDATAARVAQDLGVEHIDVRPLIEPGLETYYDFFHATPAGAAIAASAVASAIVRKALPAATPVPAPRRAS